MWENEVKILMEGPKFCSFVKVIYTFAMIKNI